MKLATPKSVSLKCTFLGLLCAGVLSGIAGSAQAGPLSSSNVKIYDDGTLVNNNTLTFTSTKVGNDWKLKIEGKTTNFAFDTVTGTSNQPGTSGGSLLRLTQTNITNIASSNGLHTFRIVFSDTGFSLPTGSPLLLMSSGTLEYTNSTTSDHATHQGYADAGNSLFGTGTTTGLQTSTSGGGLNYGDVFDANPATVSFSRSGDFSLTSDTSFYAYETNASVTISTAIGVVPEPGTFSLFGIGFAGLAGFVWKRKRS